LRPDELAAMSAFFDGLAASGALALIALAALAIEALVFVILLRRRPALLTSLLLNAASGAALMMALLTALTAGSAILIALWLAMSLTAHCCDLWIRLRQ
jgi:hypothetical protein